MAEKYGNARLIPHDSRKDCLGDGGFIVVTVAALLDVLGLRAVLFHVGSMNAVDEFLEQSANRRARIDVGLAQSVRSHAAQQRMVFKQGYRPALPGGSYGRHDATRGSAHDDDVDLGRLSHGRRQTEGPEGDSDKEDQSAQRISPIARIARTDRQQRQHSLPDPHKPNPETGYSEISMSSLLVE